MKFRLPTASGWDDETELITSFLQWREDMVRSSAFECESVRFDQSQDWRFENGILRHKTGGFFSVAGLATQARHAKLDGREQLIILQPQVAINGFLFRRVAGRAELLFQGRIEPGNIDVMQLAPTVQSTEANYKQLHGGGATPMVKWFTEQNMGRVLFDELQSEEGSRYHGKYNRNVVLEVPPDAELDAPTTFRWYPVEALRLFAASSNILNTDARSVLACMDWDVLAEEDGPLARHAPGTYGAALRESYLAGDSRAEQPLIEVLRWLTQLRVRCALRTWVVPIHELQNWTIEKDAIREKRKEVGFAARHFAVVAYGREVPFWDQPLIDSDGVGLVSLVSQRRGGVLQFLLQASHEIGFLEGVQLSASVCVPPGQDVSYDNPVERELARRIDDLDHTIIHLECCQSEEGGRFYQDENRYQVVELAEGVALPESEYYRWVTLGQIKQLVRIPGILAIELRGALALLLSYL
jgi:dTDP-4-dehydro-6-deoxy-alpha-D-glucopyranose 2,3-dehydratase